MEANQFDVVVIGSGLAGASTAYVLSQQNQKVLVIEKGNHVKRDDLDWDPKEILIKERYKSETPDYVTQYGRKQKEIFFKEIVGGQSILYGGAAFRFRENDFKRWPVSLDDFKPYYAKAEKLLHVHGQNDNPLDCNRETPFPFTPPEYSPPAQRIEKAAKKIGLNPFHIPLAIDFKKCDKCNTCDGFPCKIEAKGDADYSILRLAKENGVQVALNSEAIKIISENNKATGVLVYDRKEKTHKTYYGKNIIVAAGTIHSSALLLNSKINEDKEAGQLIGHNLMRHCNAVMGGLFPFQTNPKQVFHKQIVISDLYETMRDKDGAAVGVIQDIYTPSSDVLRAFLPPIISWAGFFGNFIQNLLCIAEEDPHFDNRVELLSSEDDKRLPQVHIHHSYEKRDYERRNLLMKKARHVLWKSGAVFFKSYKIDTFSHAVGTLRFGTSPENSALDLNCKVHHYDNLYVTDGSFMPTCAGVNPSLTIVANAIRVAEHIAKEQQA